VAGPVSWNSLPLHLHYQLSKTCSRHIFSHVPTSLTNYFAEYEQRTLYGALVVTLAMLMRLINRLLSSLLLLTNVQKLTGKISPQEDGPISRRVEPVIVAGREVYDAVVEPIEGVRQQTVVVGEVVHRRHVDVRVWKQRLKWTEKPDQRIRHALHLLQHSVLHLAAVQDLPISRTCLQYNSVCDGD